MGVKVYYSEISAHKEVKKRQQKVMMILESKAIPYEAIDITEAGREDAKDFMLQNGKPKGDSKYVLSPQVFNDDTYCGDYEDFELANENDELEQFLGVAKSETNGILRRTSASAQNGAVNGTSASREGSAEVEAKQEKVIETPQVAANPVPTEDPGESIEPPAEVEESHEEEEPMSTSEPAPQQPPQEEALENVEPDPEIEEEEEEE